MPVRNYKESLLEQLEDPREAAEYLNACLGESEEVLLLAIRDVVEARGGFTALAKKTDLNRENLYRALSRKGNPKLSSLTTVLAALGIQLSFTPAKRRVA